MTSATPTPSAPSTHRRRRVFRKPVIGSLVAASVLAGAWYATAGAAPTTTASGGLTVTNTTVSLSAKFPYLSAGYNNSREWTRTATAVAPNGTLRVAWPASDGIHVTPLTSAGKRSGADTVVKGTKEVGGLVAHNDGFALLTRVSDTNKWKETAAALIRYKGGKQAWRTKLTGTSSNDTAPLLDGQLAWNGKKYGAYFVVHGAGGFADGHFGDKLAYVGSTGKKLSGGWGWGCSHNEGIALRAETTGAFTSLCFDDWRSGLFVSTGIAAPDNAPVVQREQCWAGYCGGTFAGRTGDLVKSSTGRYATAFASRGAASAKKNPDDSSGRGWTVKPKTATHQVAIAFLKNRNTPSGKPVYLTSAKGTEHVNVHVAPYGKNRLLVSWESLKNAKCANGTCTGTFTGTHFRLVDWNGKLQGADKVVNARISGDIAVLKDGTLTWAYAPVTPSYSTPLNGASPTTKTLKIARVTP
ncbi:hypothetical protein PV416_35810 [Streptomyces ipomoeae]|uniref:Tat pathway signal sequence domain protein n=1 Tax=Streptomyces ipomoeae 91-03 TaxID=698759 RepID=L1L6Z2_9ACTN|nr:hypothetical protein [Streptomyces ipomoeae]EKX68791.1 hypothetical protein STRIP9103_07936 [Streptomyces ipomoeae 91-03]MDX2696265.1 hypothetical protein [Streptomyces ipomoeae]MDX2826295.1 hypothetical protein [Streptomyces ipomoeae]MDX2842050.1 hypothetical protein [Streptomyces ipomoeae]MDX2879162.1 hypothetical protein [Streptomyces ipomoeae]